MAHSSGRKHGTAVASTSQARRQRQWPCCQGRNRELHTAAANSDFQFVQELAPKNRFTRKPIASHQAMAHAASESWPLEGETKTFGWPTQKPQSSEFWAGPDFWGGLGGAVGLLGGEPPQNSLVWEGPSVSPGEFGPTPTATARPPASASCTSSIRAVPWRGADIQSRSSAWRGGGLTLRLRLPGCWGLHGSGGCFIFLFCVFCFLCVFLEGGGGGDCCVCLFVVCLFLFFGFFFLWGGGQVRTGWGDLGFQAIWFRESLEAPSFKQALERGAGSI